MVKFFYGMSGSFKGLTMTAEDIASEGKIVKVRSMIKIWKDSSLRIFSTSKPEDHRNYSLLHLCTLKHMIDSGSTWKPENEDLLETNFNVERGVTDSFFYYLRGKIYGREIEEEISRAVEEEMSIVSGQGEIRKILLVNKDEDFIRDVILSEPHRLEVFPGGVEEYLSEQDKYIAFTSRYNKITDVREITNARDYIEGLGFEYIPK